MKKNISLFIIVFLLNTKNYSQKNDTQAAFYNVALGSVFSGVGALINQKKENKWHKVLLKGMGQGAIGGYLVFESKRMIRNIEEKQVWEYAWGGKILNSAGISIIENASLNRKFGQNWNINIGFLRLELSLENQFKISPKIMPVSLIYGTLYGTINGRFEPLKSLQTGELIFSTINPKNVGITLSNTLIIDKEFINNYKIISHEIIHSYQYNDYNAFNTYLFEPIQSIEKKSKTIQNMNRWIYWDLQGIPLRALYYLENRNINCYYDNFFEHEAGYYSNSIICK